MPFCFNHFFNNYIRRRRLKKPGGFELFVLVFEFHFYEQGKVVLNNGESFLKLSFAA